MGHRKKLPRFLAFSLVLFFSNHLLFADSLEKIAKKLSKGAVNLKNKKVAVLTFPYHDGRESLGSSIVSERLITKLVEGKKLEVIERSLLEKVLKELKLQTSGAIDEESAKQLGKILGVEAIVSGTLIDLEEKEVEVNARLIRLETGQIVVAASGKVERFWKEEIAKKEEAAEGTAKEAAGPTQAKAPEYTYGQPIILRNSGGREMPEPPPALPMEPPPFEESGFEGPMPPPMDGQSHEEIMRETEERIWAGPIDSFLRESGFQSEVVFSPLGQQVMAGMRLIKNREWVLAEKHFSVLEEDLEGRPDLKALVRLGASISLFEVGQQDKAFRLAREIIENNRNPRLSAVAHFIIGRFNEKMGKVRAAKEHYLEVVRLQPFQTHLVRKTNHRLRILGPRPFIHPERPRLRERRERRMEAFR